MGVTYLYLAKHVKRSMYLIIENDRYFCKVFKDLKGRLGYPYNNPSK